MIARRLMLRRAAVPLCRIRSPLQRRHASQTSQNDEDEYTYPKLTDAEDPNMNGGYINPPYVKRQFRDPYADWWDKQERRNFGEPVHERDDELAMFSLHEDTFVTPGKAIFQIGCFVAAFLTLCGIVTMTYPDRPSAPREVEDGLEREYGGPRGLRARAPGDPYP